LKFLPGRNYKDAAPTALGIWLDNRNNQSYGRKNSMSPRKIIAALIFAVLIFCAAVFLYVFQSVFLTREPPTQKAYCVNYLKELEYAKEYWATENSKTTNDTPTWEDLRPYLKGSPFKCPNGGTYTIGRVGELPSCSISNDTAKYKAVR